MTEFPRAGGYARPVVPRLPSAVHLLAGWLYAFVDTDGFLPELNPFTGEFLVGAHLVYRVHTLLFSGYILWIAARFLRWHDRHWWWPLAWGTGLYAVYASGRLWFDGGLLVPYNSNDIRNVVLVSLLAAALCNPASWSEWLKPFATAAGLALLLRAGLHFVGNRQSTSSYLGVDVLGYYGTYSLHCAAVLVLAIAVVAYSIETFQWRMCLLGGATAVLFGAVLVSAFRRHPLVLSMMSSLIGLGIAYWLRRALWRKGLLAMATVVLLVPLTLGTGVLLFYGPDAVHDRVVSLANPTGASAARHSNLMYLDDWAGFRELMARHPWGIGYGKPYDLSRYADLFALTHDEIPLHIGPFEMVARTGVFGVLVIAGLISPIMLALGRMRGRVSGLVAMLAGAASAFTLCGLLFPIVGSPVGSLKILITYGLGLGVVLQLAARQAGRNAAAPGPDDDAECVSSPAWQDKAESGRGRLPPVRPDTEEQTWPR